MDRWIPEKLVRKRQYRRTCQPAAVHEAHGSGEPGDPGKEPPAAGTGRDCAGSETVGGMGGCEYEGDLCGPVRGQ